MITIGRALRHRNFRLFLTGQLLTVNGTWVQVVAQSWLVYRLSHSSIQLGLVGFASQIAYLLLGPVAGVFADRIERRRLVILTQTLAMLQAFLLAFLTLTGRIRIWEIFCLALFLSAVSAVDMPTRGAFIADMVGGEDLANAIPLNSTVMMSGRLIGPGIAGMLVALIGEGYCFLINAFGFLAVIVSLFMMRGLSGSFFKPVSASFADRFQEGIHYVWRHVPTRTLLLLIGIVNVMIYPYLVLMPVFADQVLHGGPKAMGILMSASGIGAVAGSLYAASRPSTSGIGRGITVSILVYSVALTGFAVSGRLSISIALLVLVGFGTMVQTAFAHTALQAIVPHSLRGRMMGFYAMMFFGTAPFGSLMAGWLGAAIGAPATVALGALVCFAVGIAFSRRQSAIQDSLAQAIESEGKI